MPVLVPGRYSRKRSGSLQSEFHWFHALRKVSLTMAWITSSERTFYRVAFIVLNLTNATLGEKTYISVLGSVISIFIEFNEFPWIKSWFIILYLLWVSVQFTAAYLIQALINWRGPCSAQVIAFISLRYTSSTDIRNMFTFILY